MQKENKNCCFYKGIYILKMYNNLQGVYRMWNKNTWQIAAAERTPPFNIGRWKLFHCVPHARRNEAPFAALWVKNVPPPLSTVQQSNWPSGQRVFAHSHIHTKNRASFALVATSPTMYLPCRIQQETIHSLPFYGVKPLRCLRQNSDLGRTNCKLFNRDGRSPNRGELRSHLSEATEEQAKDSKKMERTKDSK